MSYPAEQTDPGPGNREFFDRAVDRIRDAGLRLTPQRGAILELFARRDDHMTPQGIFEALEDELASLSLATVYNSLEVFEELGVLDRVCDGDGQAYFDPNTQPHQHAICRQCGDIFDLQLPSAKLDGLVNALNSDEPQSNQFEIDSVDVWLKGLCSACQ